jgi:hypothetical protein
MNDTFQQKVQPWMMECFGPEISADTKERNHRFLEEALELVQACICTKTDAHLLVEYVFNRPEGEKSQEVGGVMVTLAALCLAQQLDMHEAGDVELARIWTKVEQIRAKQASKRALFNSPLPSGEAEELHLRPEVLAFSKAIVAKAEAYDEWSEKTDWVQEQIGTFPISALGKHRADVMREEIERLRAATQLRPEVLAFALSMERKLRENDHKGGWQADHPLALMRRLKQEVEELDQAMFNGNGQKILNEGADVANFAMMIADLYHALPSKG